MSRSNKMILVCVVANLLILLIASVHLADRNFQLLSSIMGQMGDRLSITDRELLTVILSIYGVVTDLILLVLSGFGLIASGCLLFAIKPVSGGQAKKTSNGN